MKYWRWNCNRCGSWGIEFSGEAAETMLAAHLCQMPLPRPDAANQAG
jgi:hypothetical protein